MAIRSVWKGMVGFGMVSIPVKLYGAVEEQAVRFNTLHRECGKRIQMPRWCPNCERRLEQAEMVKGYPVGDDRFVTLEDQDFQGLPVKSLKNIEVVEFVDAAVIDPRHYDKPYFVSPDKAGTKAFALLLRGMAQVGKVAVAKLSMREREHLCTIRPFGEVLLLQTLYRTDELRDAQAVVIALPQVKEQELGMAVALIQALDGEGDLSRYPDEYREALMSLIEAKLNGEVIEAAPVEEAKPTEDVLAGLMASIEAVQAARQVSSQAVRA
jgi:DNA end-binding protein Ku